MDTIASSENIWPMDTMEEKRQFNDKFMLRMPDGMRDRIKSAADNNGRSMNAEIVQVLDEHYPAPRDRAIDAATAAVVKLLTSKVPRETLIPEFEDRIRQIIEDHIPSKDSDEK